MCSRNIHSPSKLQSTTNIPVEVNVWNVMKSSSRMAKRHKGKYFNVSESYEIQHLKQVIHHWFNVATVQAYDL